MDLCTGAFGFLLLLPLTLCFNFQKVVLEKLIGSDTDMTPVCKNDTDTFITTIFCKISRRNSSMPMCSLGFLGQKFVNKCGSRITLTSQNQTVFLRLMDLTAEDSGTYYCECHGKDRFSELHLNVTAEVNEQGVSNGNMKNSINIIIICSSIAVLIIICGVTVSCIYKRICCRQQSQSTTREAEEMNMYAALRQTNKDLYQTIVSVDSAGDVGSRHQHLHSEGDYENIKNCAK